MPKKILAFCGILLGTGFLYLGYNWLEDQRWKTELQRDFGPSRADELAQRNALLALGDVDLNPSYLTFAVLQQKLHEPGWKQPGDFDSTRLGWACVKERCAILATFFVPFAQEIPATSIPAGLTISSPSFREFHNIAAGGVHLGESDEQLAELDQYHRSKSFRRFRRVRWDRDWDVAWAGTDSKVFVLVFSNQTLQRRFIDDQNVAIPKPTK
ncbi:MAG TPA: hypothetical protein VE263_00615 [Candidatus Angelobacter sp.]|nr:hypothetical protein [Candidatus Angelobacter sp.]